MAKRKTTDYQPDPSNANTGTERGLRALDDSLSKYGAGRSILVDKNGYVVAGNKTLERAVDLGIEDVIEVETDGHQLVAVRRTDLDLLNDPKARELAYADNRVAELDLTWNAEQLLADLNAGVDLSQFWHEDELQVLLDGLLDNTLAQDPGAQVDKAAELQAVWQVKRGDLWEIGKHRLLCGDSTNADDVARVMAGERAILCVTDPMYDIERDDFIRFYDLAKVFAETIGVLGFGYTCSQFAAWIGAWSFDYVIETTEGLFFGNKPIQRHKLIAFWVGARHYYDKTAHYNSDGGGTSVVRFNLREARGEVEFKYSKPSVLFEHFIKIFSPTGGVVFDPFSGSGTMLVACEHTQRQARCIEIDPTTVSVALQRFQAMGLEPQLVI